MSPFEAHRVRRELGPYRINSGLAQICERSKMTRRRRSQVVIFAMQIGHRTVFREPQFPDLVRVAVTLADGRVFDSRRFSHGPHRNPVIDD